jgi:hypothetical protein
MAFFSFNVVKVQIKVLLILRSGDVDKKRRFAYHPDAVNVLCGAFLTSQKRFQTIQRCLFETE